MVSSVTGDHLEDDAQGVSTSYHVLFGLSFDILTSPSSNDAASQKAIAATSSVALELLESLVSREVAGQAILQDGIFEDLTALCFRLASTEPPVVQIRLVRLVKRLIKDYAHELELSTE